MKTKEPVAVTAIMLRGDGKDLVVEVEVEGRPGEWTTVIREYLGEISPISHIVEALGIRTALDT